MTNMSTVKRCINVINEDEKANELNIFFYRFDLRDFSQGLGTAIDSVPTSDSGAMTIDQYAVERLFHKFAPGRTLDLMELLSTY